MPNILDRVAAGPGPFRPKSVLEYFALTLARKLDEPQQAPHYVRLVDQYGEERLLQAYRCTMQDTDQQRSPAERFHAHLNGNSQGER